MFNSVIKEGFILTCCAPVDGYDDEYAASYLIYAAMSTDISNIFRNMNGEECIDTMSSIIIKFIFVTDRSIIINVNIWR